MPAALRTASQRRAGKSSPHRLNDAGAGKNHGADGGHEQRRDDGPREAARHGAKQPAGRQVAHFDLTLEHGQRGGAQKHVVQPHIQEEDHGRAGEQDAREVALRALDFAGEVHGGVPARVGVADVDQRHGKNLGSAGRASRPAAGAKRSGWGWPITSPAAINATSTSTFTAVMITCKRLPARVLRPCTRARASTTLTASAGSPGEGGARQQRRGEGRPHALGVLRQSQRGQRRGRGKAYRGGYPARQEAQRRVVYLAEVVILTSRAGHGGGQLAVAHGPAQGNKATDYPEHQQREAALDAQNLEAKAGENAGADHVGDNNGGPGAKIYLVRLSWHAGKGRGLAGIWRERRNRHFPQRAQRVTRRFAERLLRDGGFRFFIEGHGAARLAVHDAGGHGQQAFA